MIPVLANVASFGMVKISKCATAKEARALMEQMQIRHLPVVDEVHQDTVVGVISDRDLLRSPSLDRHVFELMSNPILSFDISTPLVTVAQAMVEQKVSSFLITVDDEIEGIVTSEDLLLVLVELLKQQPSAKWVIADFLVNPASQKVMSALGQAGV